MGKLWPAIKGNEILSEDSKVDDYLFTGLVSGCIRGGNPVIS
jgi:hypothetical protein